MCENNYDEKLFETNISNILFFYRDLIPSAGERLNVCTSYSSEDKEYNITVLISHDKISKIYDKSNFTVIKSTSGDSLIEATEAILQDIEESFSRRIRHA